MQGDIPLIGPIINKIFGSRNDRFVKRYGSRVDAIVALADEFSHLSDAEIRTETDALRERAQVKQGDTDIMIRAFAIARELMDRNVGIRNIFNPERREEFDSSKLPGNLKDVYEQTLKAMDEAEPREPIDRKSVV